MLLSTIFLLVICLMLAALDHVLLGFLYHSTEDVKGACVWISLSSACFHAHEVPQVRAAEAASAQGSLARRGPASRSPAE